MSSRGTWCMYCTPVYACVYVCMCVRVWLWLWILLEVWVKSLFLAVWHNSWRGYLEKRSRIWTEKSGRCGKRWILSFTIRCVFSYVAFFVVPCVLCAYVSHTKTPCVRAVDGRVVSYANMYWKRPKEKLKNDSCSRFSKVFGREWTKSRAAVCSEQKISGNFEEENEPSTFFCCGNVMLRRHSHSIPHSACHTRFLVFYLVFFHKNRTGLSCLLAVLSRAMDSICETPVFYHLCIL